MLVRRGFRAQCWTSNGAGAGGGAAPPRRVVRELWALGEGLYVVNAKPDLVANVARAVAEGLRARSPWA